MLYTSHPVKAQRISVIDSLKKNLLVTTTQEQKASTLVQLIDIALENSFSSPIRGASLKEYLKLLKELGSSIEIVNIEAYNYFLEGIEFRDAGNFQAAEQSYLNSIKLFDKVHQIIPRLLSEMRTVYNNLGQQEVRFLFYSDKLKYYSIFGPKENEVFCYHGLGGYYLYKADFNLAISNFLKCASGNKSSNNKHDWIDIQEVADAYALWGNTNKAKEYFDKAIELIRIASDTFALVTAYTNLARMNRVLNNNSVALLYADTSLSLGKKSAVVNIMLNYVEKALAHIQLNQLSDALFFLDASKSIDDSIHLTLAGGFGRFELDYGYFLYYNAAKNFREAEKYLLTAYKKSEDENENLLKLKYLKTLSLFYGEQHKNELAVVYTKKFLDLTDKQNMEQNAISIAQYENEEKDILQRENINALTRERAVQAATIKKNKIILWGSILALLIITISLLSLYRHYRMNEKSLASLKSTQAQLIQSEKMASLGELTAGIAHEIQNPLNFVNNFSELNKELVTELNEELLSGRVEDAKTIANSIRDNSEKIHLHGQRAESIVKGMLQHSRKSSGVREPTNINTLADEYMRLSYHGLRAKDKTFNVDFVMDLDPTVPLVNVVPQDIGRVLLNLFNNAFWATSTKLSGLDAKLTGSEAANSGLSYSPLVTLTTKYIGDDEAELALRSSPPHRIEIRVADNGLGIPNNIKDKIFHPFFTTKPTGQGTGLGLSLAYDIIKGLNGEIQVNSIEGQGSEFFISIPVE